MTDVPITALTRRRFGAGIGRGALALAVAGCRSRGAEHIVPAVARSAELVPGISIPYATAALRSGSAIGLLVEAREGRPIKVEGHPEHPSSLGATGPVEQALLLGLYDAERLGAIEENGRLRTFRELERAIGPESGRRFTRAAGEGLFVLLDASSSPLLGAAIERLLARWPGARVLFDPASNALASREGSRLAFGTPLDVIPDLSRIDLLLALDADPLGWGPAAIALQRHWAERRQARREALRLVVVEPTPTLTGMRADVRHALRGGDVGRLAAGLATRLLAPEIRDAASAHASGTELVESLARELEAYRGRAAVVVGDSQPAWVHAIGHAIEDAIDAPVVRIDSPLLGLEHDVAPLLDASRSGELDVLVTAGTNPAYTWPAAARPRTALHVHVAAFRDETAALADWIVPAAHVLERWGDARAHDGTWTTIQPLIEPLCGGRTIESVLGALSGDRRSERDDLRRALEDAGHDADAVIGRGLVPGSAFAPRRAAVDVRAIAGAIAAAPPSPTPPYELELRPDRRIEDGRHAENAWLQELPEPVTKIVWGNAALIAREDAEAARIADGDEVELTTEDGTVRLPACIVPGQARGSIAVWRGFGRRAGGRRAIGVGVDVAPLSPAIGASRVGVLRITATGGTARLVRTQRDFHDELRPHELERGGDTDPPSFYADWPERGVQWGMAIDLDVCTGCSACVVACQVENDVPVVGAEQVALGREMHWLRIDRYVRQDGRFELQPMLCQHCEHAPCEYVCPTHATTHSSDGLNQMVYNRCVGTRFCANNCPYKVRRFNWIDWNRDVPPRERLAWSPDVTVRARGVMEKCTYCVQRIRRAQSAARIEERALGDRDVVTACQQACPTGAIVFGRVDDPTSDVSLMHADARAYAELGELGTRPRTRYLRRRS